jgi:hypothetical protein
MKNDSEIVDELEKSSLRNEDVCFYFEIHEQSNQIICQKRLKSHFFLPCTHQK